MYAVWLELSGGGRDNARTPALRRGKSVSASRSTTRLLIVDDDEELRATLSARFTRLGMNVTAVSSGEEGLAKAGQARFDVALFDLHLPGIGGIDLLTRFKELQP